MRGLAALIVMVSSVASTQPAQPSPATVLANVQQFYANASQLTAKFRQVVTNPTFGTSTSSDGSVWVAKPSYFRFDYVARKSHGVAVTKTFIFDGKDIWYVDHANKTITKRSVQQSSLPAAVSFLTGGTALTTQFNVARAAGDANTIVLELTPKQPSAQYKQLLFHVDAVTWRVTESIVVDTNGETNDFTFFDPDVTTSVKPSWFVVNPASMPAYAYKP